MGNSDLKAFFDSHQKLFVLTGAGCITNSGIPDYRDADGRWKRTQPMRFQAFVAEDAARRHYWARSMIGWRRFEQALLIPWPGSRPAVGAKCCSRRMSTDCIRPLGAGR